MSFQTLRKSDLIKHTLIITKECRNLWCQIRGIHLYIKLFIMTYFILFGQLWFIISFENILRLNKGRLIHSIII